MAPILSHTGAIREFYARVRLRRHLTHGQKVALALEAMKLLEEEAKQRQLAGKKIDLESKMTEGSPKGLKGRARTIAAQELKISDGSMVQAAIVRREDPKAFEQIKRGELKVGTVSKLKIAAIPASFVTVGGVSDSTAVSNSCSGTLATRTAVLI